MSRALLFLFPLVLSLMGCLKDDLDPSTLTTNPLDPDYNGPALIELVSDTTRIVYAGSLPIDTVVEQQIHIRTELLPAGTDYALYVTKVNTGVVYDYTNSGTPQDRAYHHVVPGVSYCYDYQLKVQFSYTKAYRYCTTANP